MIALVVIGAGLLYALIGGVTYAVLPADVREDELGNPFVIIAPILWPVALPGMLGAALVARLRRPRPKLLPRAEVRRG